jgi:hypothetical protein
MGGRRIETSRSRAALLLDEWAMKLRVQDCSTSVQSKDLDADSKLEAGGHYLS